MLSVGGAAIRFFAFTEIAMRAIVSIIVPAFNERERLPAFLAGVREYCDGTFGESYEVIVVNDGSSDGTREFLDHAAGNWSRLSRIDHARNRGKGTAVRSGMQAARGDYWLFADADGATPICEERKLREAVVAGAEIAVGSRPVACAAGHDGRPFIRWALSGAFRRVSRIFFRLSVHDSQCGFKMFRRGVGHRLAALTREPGYLFDFELLVLADYFGYRVAEVPVAWHDISGSKVRVIRDSLNMLCGLVRLRSRLGSSSRLRKLANANYTDFALPRAGGTVSPAVERMPAVSKQISEPACAFPRVSLIVPVRERASAMARLFDAIAAQSLPKEVFEVLVCDDGSSEGEAAAIESLVMKARAEHDLTVAYLRQPRAGAGAARNLGLAHADGDLLVFTDSDCVPDREWLARVSAAFDDPAIGIVGGPAEYRGAATLAGRCANFLMTTTLGAGGACDPRSALHVKFVPRSYNLAVRRELALAVGGFPASFYGEDVEFSERVAALGAGVAFLAGAIVVHDERRSPWGTVAASFKKGLKRVQIARRCGMHNVLYAAPAILVAIFAVWLALFSARSPLAFWPGVALLAYGLAMIGLGVYGGFAMREAVAAAALPFYAVLIHTAYGVGYWWGLFGLAQGRVRFDPPSTRPSSGGRGREAPRSLCETDAAVSFMPPSPQPLPAGAGVTEQ